MHRSVYALIDIDEERAMGIDPFYAPITFLRRAFVWVQAMLGINVTECVVCQDQTGASWERYVSYLHEWAFSHASHEYTGMSPACYQEWSENEDLKH